jgi:hypothetical protein
LGCYPANVSRFNRYNRIVSVPTLLYFIKIQR